MLKFKTKQEAIQLAERAEEQARDAQGKPFAEYLRGRAHALRDIADGFDSEAIYRHVECAYRLDDAARQLLNYFGISADNDEAENAHNHEILARALGASYEALTDPSSDEYILDILVEHFEDAFDCNVSENDTWSNVIQEFIEENQ